MPSRPSPGSYPGPVQVPSRVRGGPVQIRHVLCFAVFRTHPGPEVGAIPACPGPILLPSIPYRNGPGRAETDFLATSDHCKQFQFNFLRFPMPSACLNLSVCSANICIWRSVCRDPIQKTSRSSCLSEALGILSESGQVLPPSMLHLSFPYRLLSFRGCFMACTFLA